MVFLDYLPRIRIGELTELIYTQKQTEKLAICRLVTGGTKYSITVCLDEGYFTFSWEYRNQHFKQDIRFISVPSHLGKGESRFFICPYTGRKCFKLYLFGKVIASRYAFNHVYSYQHDSKVSRVFRGCGEKDNPRRKYGKTMYKGRITPYGKSIDRYNSKLHRFTVMLESSILIPKPKGRKPKGERTVSFSD